jgi:recombination protein RecA
MTAQRSIQIEDLFSRGNLGRPSVLPPTSAPWSFAEIAGRLVEVSGLGASAALTLAFDWVMEAQRRGEPVGWVTSQDSSFYPPDAAEGGIDLGSLAVVRIPDNRSIPRAGDRLVRSGAFGLVVLDVGAVDIPVPLQARLAGLAQKHHTALVCLTEKDRERPSLGSLVSLRVQAERAKKGKGLFACDLKVLKDKRRGPAWSHREILRGPAGLH